MKKINCIILSVLAGLFISQCIASLHVYFSNENLYQSLKTMSDAGYLIVPDKKLMPGLKEFFPAFFGGLFFTLSLGSGLSILSLVCAWMWKRVFRQSILFLILFILLWIGSLILINFYGFNPMPSCYFIIIPPVVFIIFSKLACQPGKKDSINLLIATIPIIFLILISIVKLNHISFIDIRDYLLLSNTLGIKINDFYYKYTLYPAESFKSLDQKLLKTCSLKYKENNLNILKLKNIMINHDYIPVDKSLEVDLELIVNKEKLLLKNKDKIIIKTTFKPFIRNSTKILKKFSIKTDRNEFLRHSAFLSILFGLPIMLYIFIYSFFCFAVHKSCQFFKKNSISFQKILLISAILCIFTGLIIISYLPLHKQNNIEISKALKSESWQVRLRALKTILNDKLDLTDFNDYSKLLSSKSIGERYWLVRCLSISKSPDTYNDILKFLDDPQINVVCQALYSLGRRGDKKAIKEILKRIKQSNNWYNQWYAYKALKKLGWRQCGL
ncbi:HEAT repeat domain-containing protein [Candidatus Magnetomoraceae bacterium gMMP-15]